MMFRVILVCLVCAVALCGCQKRKDVAPEIIAQDEKQCFVAILLDLSGSFSDQMAHNGKAHEFAMQVLHQYFEERMGSSDKIIIAQISGTDRSLLWQGTPEQLRQDFGSSTKFRDFLLSKADPNGSRVHDAITQTVDYVATDPGVASKKVKSAVFVLSDLIDNHPDTEKSRKRMIEALSRYGKLGGTCAFYYVDQLLVPEMRNHLQLSGLKNYCIEAEIVGRPNLPNFE